MCEVDEEPVVGLGRSASLMDAMLSVVDAALENPRIPAWFTVFGQFVAHDITYDQSALAHRAIASELRNFRAPRLDLESHCGTGPIGAPFLYDAEDPDKLLLGTNPAGELHDLPRNSQGRAPVGDPRNDVHLIISQMHLAFLKFHNRVVDWLREAYDGAQTIHDDHPCSSSRVSRLEQREKRFKSRRVAGTGCCTPPVLPRPGDVRHPPREPIRTRINSIDLFEFDVV